MTLALIFANVVQLDSFTLAMMFIILTTFIAALISRNRQDKCLKNFRDDVVTLERIGSTTLIKGHLLLRSTGLELLYPEFQENANKIDKPQIEYLEYSTPKAAAEPLNFTAASFIFYKYEYPQIQALIRFHKDLTDAQKEARRHELERVYHPGRLRRWRRRVMNMFKTVRDSLSEVLSLLVSEVKKVGTTANMVASQNKYVSRIQNELIESVGTAYEPLFERYIGHIVVFELIKDEKISKFTGVLKEYTVDYIELMDVQYRCHGSKTTELADLIIPQKLGVIRHFGEENRM